jgi:hypothetical protein
MRKRNLKHNFLGQISYLISSPLTKMCYNSKCIAIFFLDIFSSLFSIKLSHILANFPLLRSYTLIIGMKMRGRKKQSRVVKIENDDMKGVWDYFIDGRYFNIPTLLPYRHRNIIINFINPLFTFR